jgi:hypothetical protein
MWYPRDVSTFSVDPNELGGEGNPLHPYDPFCRRYAAEMEDYDSFIFESEEDERDNGPVTPEMRENYVIREEGTYNHLNGHFACDSCYIDLKMPSGPGGWHAP